MRLKRSKIHDPAETPGPHPGNDRTRGDNQPIDIRVPHALHLAVVEIREIAAPEDAGIVDQNVDWAKLALQFLDHGANGDGITHVSPQRQCFPARSPNFRGQRFSVRRALPVIDPDGGAFARQP